MTGRRVAAAFACVLAMAAPALAANRDPADLTGVWWPVQPHGSDFKPDPPLTPAAQKDWDEVRAAMSAGKTVQDSAGSCVPPGTPRLMTRVYPIQWVRYGAGWVLIHEFENAVRWIYTDGRKPPAADDVLPAYNGYSIGHWEGRTLVVETSGFKPTSDTGRQVWIEMGVPVTPQLKLTEKYSLTDAGKGMKVELIMSDPSIFTRPWVTEKQFELKTDVEIMEFTCLADENPIEYAPDGSAGFRDFSKPAQK